MTAEDISKVDYPLLTVRVVRNSAENSRTANEKAVKDGFKVYSEDEEKTVYVKNAVGEGLPLTEAELKVALKVRWTGDEEPYR